MATLDAIGTPTLTQRDMPIVRFDSRDEIDRAESARQGRQVHVDMHFAIITPPGSKDEHPEKLPEWWGKVAREVAAGRLKDEWVERWKANYERWRQGQEIPVDGTPIRGWTMLTKAQQENVIACNILTVESLAVANAEAMTRIGMGALELKRRAESWVLEKECLESGATKMGELQRENDILKETVANLKEKVDALSKMVEKKGRRGGDAE